MTSTCNADFGYNVKGDVTSSWRPADVRRGYGQTSCCGQDMVIYMSMSMRQLSDSTDGPRSHNFKDFIWNVQCGTLRCRWSSVVVPMSHDRECAWCF